MEYLDFRQTIIEIVGVNGLVGSGDLVDNWIRSLPAAVGSKQADTYSIHDIRREDMNTIIEARAPALIADANALRIPQPPRGGGAAGL